MRGEELDLRGMTWYGALAAIILIMLSFLREGRRRFDPTGHTNSDIERMVAEAIHKKRDREIILDRLTSGIGYEQLAEIHELSVAQVKRIVYRCENALAGMR